MTALFLLTGLLLSIEVIAQDSAIVSSVKSDTIYCSVNGELDVINTKERCIVCEKNIAINVESDNATLTAEKKGKIKWKINIISACCKPSVGKPEIRYIKLNNNETISVTFGKHNYAIIDINTGRITCLGAD